MMNDLVHVKIECERRGIYCRKLRKPGIIGTTMSKGGKPVLFEGDAELIVLSSQGGGGSYSWAHQGGHLGKVLSLTQPVLWANISSWQRSPSHSACLKPSRSLPAQLPSCKLICPSEHRLMVWLRESINASVDFSGIAGVFDDASAAGNSFPFDRNVSIELTAVPDPSSVWALLVALCGLAAFRRREIR